MTELPWTPTTKYLHKIKPTFQSLNDYTYSDTTNSFPKQLMRAAWPVCDSAGSFFVSLFLFFLPVTTLPTILLHWYRNIPLSSKPSKSVGSGRYKGGDIYLSWCLSSDGFATKILDGRPTSLFGCNSKPRKPNRCKISQIKFIQVLLLCRSQNKCRLISTLNSKLDAWVTRLTRVSALAETAHRIPLRYKKRMS